jgi:hypothetical protein
MIKYRLLNYCFFLFLIIIPGFAHADCLQELGSEIFLGKPLGFYFSMEIKKVAALKKTPTLALRYVSKTRLTNKEEEQLYYNTLYRFDDLLKIGNVRLAHGGCSLFSLTPV